MAFTNMGMAGGMSMPGIPAPMPQDLQLRGSCNRCGSTGSSDSMGLFAASCRHMTLCTACGKAMAQSAAPCTECGLPVKKLIKEFKVRSPASSKQYFIGRFQQGVPKFKETQWSMSRESQTVENREKYKARADKKSRAWVLEDEGCSQQFQGHLEGGQQAVYFYLVRHGKDFHSLPLGAWYNFHKFVQYKQLTLEEAEEQIKNRRKTADGYQRWMMRSANTGGGVETEKPGKSAGRAKKFDDEDSDRGEDEEDEDRKNKLNPNKPVKEEDDDAPKAEDFDPEDEVDRGDDWEHEETFTDDDEAVAIDPEEREDLPDLPAPPEIKQEEEDEVENQEGQQTEEGGGLSQSGRELKKLLGKSGGLDESDGDEDEEDEDVDLDNEDLSSPVLAPKRNEGGSQKEEAADGTPTKANGAATAKAATGNSKGKRKVSDDKAAAGSSKKSKNDSREIKKDTAKKESAKKEGGSGKGGGSKEGVGKGVVTEEEVRAVMKQSSPMTTQDLVAKFKYRLKTSEEKNIFAGILKKISRIQKRDGASFIVLK